MSTTLKIVVSNAETSCSCHQKEVGGFSSPQGLLQASQRVYLLPASKAGKMGCLRTLKWPREEAVIFQVVYTSHLPQNPASLRVPTASSVWIPCLGLREQRAAAVLCVCPGSCSQCPSPSCHHSSQHFCRVLGISSSFWGQTDSSEVDWHSIKHARRLCTWVSIPQ